MPSETSGKFAGGQGGRRRLIGQGKGRLAVATGGLRALETFFRENARRQYGAPRLPVRSILQQAQYADTVDSFDGRCGDDDALHGRRGQQPVRYD